MSQSAADASGPPHDIPTSIDKAAEAGQSLGEGDTRRPASSGPDLQTWRLARRRLSDLKLPADAVREDPDDPESTDSLRQSIAQHGLLVPLLIEPDGTVRGGSRRLAALRSLAEPAEQQAIPGFEKKPPGDGSLTNRWSEIECVILPPGTDPRLAELVENIHRKDLSPVEEAHAYSRLLATTGWTQTRLAKEMGLSDERVSRVLNLLRAPPEVQRQVESGEVSPEAIKRAYGSRAERVREQVARGELIAVRYTEPSVRVPRRLLPEGLRARVFTDRVEMSIMLPDEVHTVFTERETQKKRAIGLSEAIHKKLVTTEDDLLGCLREARRKVLELDGRESPQ